MRNILLFFLLATCLSLGQQAIAQGVGVEVHGKGWDLTKDSCLTIHKDYDGETISVLDEYGNDVTVYRTERLVIEEGVTSTENFQWGSSSYQYCNYLSSITLPRSMTNLAIMRKHSEFGMERAYSYFAADTVVCLSEVPPSIDNGVFLQGHGILQVPEGCVEAYRSSDWAIYFYAIVDRPDTAIVKQPYGRGWEIRDDSVLVINKDYVWPPTGLDYYQQYEWHYPWGKINTVILEEGVTYVGDGFCTSFRGYLSLPSTIEDCGSAAFFEANILGDLVVCFDAKKALEWLKSIEGDLIIAAGGVFYGELSGSLGGELIFRNGMKAIGDDAFSSSWWENKPIPALPPSIERIGARAFKGRTLQESFVVPPSVKEIGDEAFAGTNIVHIYLPSSLEKVGARVFADRKECALVIHCYAVEPPELESTYEFISCAGSGSDDGYLEVPEESLDKYKASPWGMLFADPVEKTWRPYEYTYTSLKDTGGETVRVSVEGGVVSVFGGGPFDVYDQAGRKMPSGLPLPAGVYVVSTAAGSQKVVVK